MLLPNIDDSVTLSIVLFIDSEGILFFISFKLSTKLLPIFTSFKVFKNSFDILLSIFLAVVSKACDNVLPLSKVSASISKKNIASCSNSKPLFLIG